MSPGWGWDEIPIVLKRAVRAPSSEIACSMKLVCARCTMLCVISKKVKIVRERRESDLE